jgi:hypothetical protein
MIFHIKKNSSDQEKKEFLIITADYLFINQKYPNYRVLPLPRLIIFFTQFVIVFPEMIPLLNWISIPS